MLASTDWPSIIERTLFNGRHNDHAPDGDVKKGEFNYPFNQTPDDSFIINFSAAIALPDCLKIIKYAPAGKS